MDYEQLVTAIDAASQALLGRAAKAVNQALVLRNWLIGAHLFEFEQSGHDRARYGQELLPNLATDLKRRGLKGLGISMLRIAANFIGFTRRFANHCLANSRRFPRNQKLANQRLANSIQVCKRSRPSICCGSPGHNSSN